MSEHKKKSLSSEPNMSLNEALARLLQTDPKEMANAFERTKKRADEVRRSADQQYERLKSAISGPKKQFRL